MSEKQISTTHKLVLMAMLVAAQIVLSRILSINLWNLRIGFSFVPIVMAGILLGPVGAGLTGAVADIIGATLFPTGAFFPGFTFTAFLTAFGYGFFLQKKQDLPHILAAVLFSEIIGSILLNTLWISILYGTPFLALLPARVMQAVGMGIVEVIVIRLLASYVPQLKKVI
ncbi:folate family ECF transporter S component [Anaerotignum sp.]